MSHAKELRKIGAAIRAARLGLGVSQDSFADLIEMHRAYYGAIERGQQNITIATLLRVSKGLGLPPSQILESAQL